MAPAAALLRAPITPDEVSERALQPAEARFDGSAAGPLGSLGAAPLVPAVAIASACRTPAIACRILAIARLGSCPYGGGEASDSLLERVHALGELSLLPVHAL